MIVLAGSIRVPVENIGKLTPHVQAFVIAVRTEPGCLAFSLAFDVVEPGQLRFFEVFENDEAYGAHRTTPHVLEWRKILADCGFNGREMSKYDVSGVTKV